MQDERRPETLTEDNFPSEILESAETAVVDFWADWCAPCRAVAPVVAKLANEFDGRVTVGKVNVDDEPGLAQAYGIRSIPALLIFKGGEVVDQIAGAVPFDQLSERVEHVLAKN